MDINKFFDGVNKNKKIYILDLRHKEFIDEYNFDSLTSETLSFKRGSKDKMHFELQYASVFPVFEDNEWFLQIQGGYGKMYYNIFVFKTKKLAKKMINMYIEAETESLKALSNLVNKNTPNFYKLINAFIGNSSSSAQKLKKDKTNKNI
jgi:hypothetical protein